MKTKRATLPKLSKPQINKSVVGLCEQLGIKQGSAFDIDLYVLLQSYLLDIDKRDEINTIINNINYKNE